MIYELFNESRRNTNEHVDLSEPLKVYATTWNVGKAFPDVANIHHWIEEKDCDLYVICLQEGGKMTAVKDGLFKYFNRLPQDSTHTPDTLLNSEFTLMYNMKLLEISFFIFGRRRLTPYISNIQGTTVATGLGDIVGNKGGVAFALQLMNQRLCFVGSHLAARETRITERMQNIQSIIKKSNLFSQDSNGGDLLSQFDHVIWLGDLNYRITVPWDECLQLIEDENWPVLIAADQLTVELNKGMIFQGFEEGQLHFRPSYRMIRDKEEWSDKRKQSPSWTDRVLWLSAPGSKHELKHTSYRRHGQMYGSDHRPISATFDLTLKKYYGGLLMSTQFTRTAARPNGDAYIHLTDLVIQPARVATDKKESQLNGDLSVRVASNVLLQAQVVGQLQQTTDGSWHMSDSDKVSFNNFMLRPFILERDFLEKQNLMLTFTSVSNGAVLGYTVIPLNQPNYQSLITINGKLMAHCSGKVEMDGL